MKKTIKQNENGGTEVHFGTHVVTVQISVNTAPPDASPNTMVQDAFSTWMKLDNNKWIQGFDPLSANVMKVVERLMQMKPAQILTYFANRM